MAAAIPSTVLSTSAGFQPAFEFVSIEVDRHADSLAVVASVAGVSLKDIFKQAEALGMPKAGPYNHRIDSILLSCLLACWLRLGHDRVERGDCDDTSSRAQHLPS